MQASSRVCAHANACSARATLVTAKSMVHKPQQRVVRARAGGFGSSNKKRIETPADSVYVPRKPRLTADDEEEQASTASAPQGPAAGSASFFSPNRLNSPGGSWVNVEDNIEEFFRQAGRDVKAKTLDAGRTIVLYRHQGSSGTPTVYCSHVEASTFKFPMVDAKLMDGPDGAPIVEVPLDGTRYNLRNGDVLEWTPQGKNPIQGFLNNLKKATPPEPLIVYPTQVTKEGGLMVRLS